MQRPVYRDVDAGSLGWSEMVGGEVADLCNYDTDADFVIPDLGFAVQRSWSNRAAQKSHNPCVPAAPAFYFNAAPELPDAVFTKTHRGTRGVIAPSGRTVSFPVKIFSDGPTGDIELTTDTRFSHGIYDLVFDKTTVRNGDTAQLSVRTIVTSDGESDVFLVVSTAGNTRRVWPVLVNHH